MDRFDIDRYVIGCWSMPPRNTVPDAAYWRTMRDNGFNAVVGADYAPVSKTNDLQPVIGFVRGYPDPKSPDFDLLHSLGIRLMLCAVFDRAPQVATRHNRIGRHPAVMGYWLCDNCGLHDITADAAWWLKQYAPKMVPWVSTNPMPIPQARVSMPVISSQNYPYLFGANGNDEHLRKDFVRTCNSDRSAANRYGLAVWMIPATDGSASQYRFQQHASAAYGAQGIWLFGYHGYTRMALKRAVRATNHYIVNIAGPWLLGRRSAEVLHTGPDIPPQHDTPGPGKLITAMDDHLMAGLLVPDEQFQAGIIAPDCIYVVDKRTKKFDEREELKRFCLAPGAEEKPLPARARELIKKMYAAEPKPRAARITLSAGVRSAAALLPDGTRKRYDLTASRTIQLPPMEPGSGLLLRIDAEPLKTIRVPKGTVVRELPNPWKFAFERGASAEKEKWASPEFDDSKWKQIKAGVYGGWSYQGYGARGGGGWYRLKYTVPEDMRKKHIYLHFGAADEQAWVFVDGKMIVEHSCGKLKLPPASTWTLPFSGECPELADGKEHTIVVKVANVYGTGGLYEPVHVVTSDEPLDTDQLWRAVRPELLKRIRQ